MGPCAPLSPLENLAVIEERPLVREEGGETHVLTLAMPLLATTHFGL